MENYYNLAARVKVSQNLVALTNNRLNWCYKPPFFLLLWCCTSSMVHAQESAHWLMGGQNFSNTRNAASENRISPETAGNLVTKWAFTTEGDVSATPAVDGKAVYFPDWRGNLYSIDAETGGLVWKKKIIDYTTGQTTNFARATPAIAGDKLIIGTQMGNPKIGAHVLAINKLTGQLLWKTQVDNHPASIITQSAVVYGDRAYVGVASLEEGIASDPTYPCCNFRGSMVCLNVNTGQVLWKTYTVPQITPQAGSKGYSGGAIWGSTPVIDTKRNSVYITTGNNYTVPNSVTSCVARGGTADQVRACILATEDATKNYVDAFVAMDLTTGAVKWAKSAQPFDAWTVACFFGGPNCPPNAGPDYDFGQGPALFGVGSGNTKRELLGAGQKSGIYWALNPDNGEVVWQTKVGPGGELGGLQWGSAVDGQRVYTAVSNYRLDPYALTVGPGAGTVVRGGFWASLNAETGAKIWEVAASNPPANGAPAGTVATNQGMVTVANGVVFAGAMDAPGTMYAFNAATGEKLWSFESGGSVNSGAAVVKGSVYWGSGYTNFGLGTPGYKLYAFKIGPAKQVSEAIPTTYMLGQNTPNPLYSTTEIRFKTPKTGKVTLSVYDVNGVEVERLVDEVLAAGEYRSIWNAASKPSGMYIYRLTAGWFSESKHMLIAK